MDRLAYFFCHFFFVRIYQGALKHNRYMMVVIIEVVTELLLSSLEVIISQGTQILPFSKFSSCLLKKCHGDVIVNGCLFLI